METFYKDVGSKLDYERDWGPWLGADTIATSSWSVPTGLTKVSEANTTTTATVVVSGGSEGVSNLLSNTIVTAAGLTDVRYFWLVVGATESLASLVIRLKEDVPAWEETPTDEQYLRCVRGAIGDYQALVPLKKRTTVSVVAGTASYDLPSDFLAVIRLPALTSPDNVLVSGAGLIPTDASGRDERWEIVGQTITFYPTPTYTLERVLWYSAGYVIEGSNEYQGLSEAQAETVLLRAAARALRMQANYAARMAWQYTVESERVSKEQLSKAFAAQAQELDGQFAQVVSDAGGGAVGMRARYTRAGK